MHVRSSLYVKVGPSQISAHVDPLVTSRVRTRRTSESRDKSSEANIFDVLLSTKEKGRKNTPRQPSNSQCILLLKETELS